MIRTFQDLIVWQKAHQLTLNIYRITKKFPPEEKFGLTGDVRRAARSVATNIVEGYKRKGYKDALNFFNRSDASLAEVKYHLIISLELDYLDKAEYQELIVMAEETGKTLNGWQKNYQSRTQC